MKQARVRYTELKGLGRSGVILVNDLLTQAAADVHRCMTRREKRDAVLRAGVFVFRNLVDPPSISWRGVRSARTSIRQAHQNHPSVRQLPAQ